MPRLALTPGEPAGIGPDLTVLLAERARDYELVVVGDAEAMEARARRLGLALDTVPEFQKVMDRLKPGELSQPFQTPLGWFLIEVTARREKDMTAERAKLEARKAIFERKAEEAYQDWVRQLRDAAYVEIFPHP